VDGLFAAFVDTDDKKSDQYALSLNQGGLGLPDEAYYREQKYEAIRDAYRAHIRKMFELANLPDPGGLGQTVMEVETRLARGTGTACGAATPPRRTTSSTARPWPSSPRRWTSSGSWRRTGPRGSSVIVRQPSYLTAMAEAVDEVPPDAWRTGSPGRSCNPAPPLLNKAFAEESFGFYGRTLSGTPEQRPRWKRGVGMVEGAMGEALGKLFVAEHFPPAAKEKMQKLVQNLIAAYREDIRSLDWMSPETKAKALDKLAKFTPKIGYPDKWREYAGLEIDRDDLVGNARRSAAFENAYELKKLGGPVDRQEWHMTPQTVNAYYNPGMNEIVFPAAILRPPFFTWRATTR
jgi:putative endopeptidase